MLPFAGEVEITNTGPAPAAFVAAMTGPVIDPSVLPTAAATTTTARTTPATTPTTTTPATTTEPAACPSYRENDQYPLQQCDIGGRALQIQLSAWVGRVDESRSLASEALALFATGVVPTYSLLVCEAMAMAELSAGNAGAAAAYVYPAIETAIAIGFDEPAALYAVPDAIEALIRSDRLDDAEPLIDWVESSSARPGHWWARAVGERCRGLLLAARGLVDEAATAFARAVSAHDHIPQLGYERARTLLAAGRFERRRGQRRAARAMLAEAADVFDEFGAAQWAANARAELEGLGLKPTGDGALTVAERRVAELAASGMTNREIAAAVLVSAKTVEAHLGRIYRKLGVRGRAELGRRMAEQPTP